MAFDTLAFVQRELAKPTNVGRRTNKHRSGRAGRRQANGRAVLEAAGGTRSVIKAIYAPADQELCNTAPESTGTRNGRPFRDPQVGQGAYLQGRGA